MPGYLLFVDGALNAGSKFQDIQTTRQTLADLPDHSTIYKLRELAGVLESTLSTNDPKMGEILYRFSSLHHGASTPDYEVATSVSSIEYVRMWVGAAHWGHVAKRYLRGSWIWSTLMSEIRMVGEQALYALPENDLPNSDPRREEWNQVHNEIIKHGPGMFYQRVDTRAIIDRIEWIRDHLSEPASLVRHINELHLHLRSGKDTKAWVDELSTDFNILLARSNRVRNSITHGGPIELSVVRSVAGFLHGLAQFAVALAMHTLVHGKNLKDTLDQSVRDHRQMRRALLESTPRDALYWESDRTKPSC